VVLTVLLTLLTFLAQAAIAAHFRMGCLKRESALDKHRNYGEQGEKTILLTVK